LLYAKITYINETAYDERLKNDITKNGCFIVLSIS